MTNEIKDETTIEKAIKKRSWKVDAILRKENYQYAVNRKTNLFASLG